MPTVPSLAPLLAAAALLAAAPGRLLAVNGVTLIDQNRALTGNITAGDGPGFPITISQPGSYRLNGPITVPDADTTAFEVTSPDVTLDLNGFTISGPTVCQGKPPVCQGTGAGIRAQCPAALANNTLMLNMGGGLVTVEPGCSVSNPAPGAAAQAGQRAP